MTLEPVVGVIAAGAMGAAVSRRLTQNGITVLTVLEGRSAASVARAQEAGMQPVAEPELARAGLLLSIVPPGEAVALARRLAPVLAQGGGSPAYVDCNAVSPQTAIRIGEIVSAQGLRFVDAGIIGGPPKPGTPGPLFCCSGQHADALAALGGHGLRVRVLDGPVGAASGLKMSYAGITKGSTALAAAMMLAAVRHGAGQELRTELASSQPELLARFEHSVPDMFPKAYRWVAEMREISAFAGEDAAAGSIYEAIAQLFERLAQDMAGSQDEIGRLRAFFAA